MEERPQTSLYPPKGFKTCDQWPFIQLKTDVVEGRLRCNHEQAIVLASYSLQVEIHLPKSFHHKFNISPKAEFGDHDPEKHTAEYLKDFPLLPKPLVAQFEVG